mmetsp:Transcript_13179/g.13285  ORF Transcript_13179/g.13285 Transcript_13179/m.13285 type:complete len:336 (-) Transcript_13179:43-1050(-)
MLWNMITDYCETFKNTIRGKFERRGNSRIAKDLAGGVTIKHYFNTLLEDYSGNYNATEDYSNEEIQRIMAQHEGDNIPGFPSVDVLLFLLQPQLEMIKGPVLDCLNNVHSYLDQLSHKIIERVFYRFPSLVAEIGDISSHVLIKERENCRIIVEELVDSEEGYIFTNDVEYLAKRTDLIPKSDNKVPKTPESLFVDEIRSRIDTYFRIVVRNVRDTVPKIIGYFLVRSVMDKMQMQLYEAINRSETVLNLLSEPAHITTERENIRKQLSTLRKAEKILKHDPNLALQANSIEDEISKIESEASESGTAKKIAEEKKKPEDDVRPSKTPSKGLFSS